MDTLLLRHRRLLALVIGFILFGAILQFTGGGRFFNDLALALVGRYRGGAIPPHGRARSRAARPAPCRHQLQASPG